MLQELLHTGMGAGLLLKEKVEDELKLIQLKCKYYKINTKYIG